MARATKRKKGKTKGFTLFDEYGSGAGGAQEDLPKDEAGRLKIKRQYNELLGIRVTKLAGRILNRERINKTIEGVYFICIDCRTVSHNMDDGLVEDPDNVDNRCGRCAKAKGIPVPPAGKTAAA